LLALGEWGSTAPIPPGSPQLGVDSTIIALRTLFDARAAGDLAATYELRLGDQVFRARVDGGELELERGEAPEADATIVSDPWPLGGMLWQGYALEDAESAGDASVEGDRRAVVRFLQLFPLPASG
jgi:alkyl sulfatase BDS1-like metallo-beta-lactamase superfamily hydrolase